MKLFDARAWRTLQFGSIALASSALVACGGGGSSPTATIHGTAAVGAALANATIQLSCKNGSGSTTSNSSGSYSDTFSFDGPCLITATSGSTVLNSFASGAGTYNVTPLTQLLLSYLAGQLGTTLNGLLAGITTNATFQSALTNSTVIANAETAVTQLIKSTYGVTLSTNSFLTVSFTPGQPGADADLDTLQTDGAITSEGQPAASLATAAVAAGAAAPISGGTAPGKTTGGTGGTGGAGT
ncbi:carboxypeptidase regulatory-like domain-containing protein [Paraburkholderia sp. GAS348]|uniref:carboxypeptidase regulatory-like domain-containing protein n=1 Tax=Paraburkholderia sp. GAS348 TaxID=3035132 RepID=UPI003D1DDD8E